MPKYIAVKAPLSGIYYEASIPGDPPFVALGKVVQAEDVVALIESMKVFIEVRAEVAGTVRRIAVKNEQQVSSGTVLLEVEVP